MDIFIQNVPLEFREGQLIDFLKPYLASSNITTFSCRKFKGKTHANITVFDISAANLFLSKHGRPQSGSKSSRPKQPLILHNKELRCLIGRTVPNPLHVEALRREEAERLRHFSQPRKKAANDISSLQHTFTFVGFDNGVWDYEDTSLQFHSCYRDSRRGSLVLGRKAMIIVLMEEGQTTQDFSSTTSQIRVQYQTIESIAMGRGRTPSISITLNQSPNFYRVSETGSLLAGFQHMSLNKSRPDRVRACGLSPAHEKLSGLCLVYRIQLADSSQLATINSVLRNMDGGPGRPEHDHSVASFPRNVAQERDQLIKRLSPSAESANTSSDFLPFLLRFQLQRLVQNGYLNPARTFELAMGVRPLLKRHTLLAVIDAIQTAARRLPFISPEVDVTSLHVNRILEGIDKAATQFNRKGSIYEMAEKHKHMALIHKVVVTPCNMYLEGPQLEAKNRVLRKYPDHAEHFIRVSFLDEDEQSIMYDSKVDQSELFWSRFSKVINGKIDICGRLYSFLGFSHSSLRTHQCWFMSPFSHDSTLHIPSQVIQGLGNFTTFRSPAKCAARIGQTFSDTTDSIPLSDQCRVVRLDDVERNGRCFTDGVGTISQALLAKVWGNFTRTRKQHATLLQVRQAGAKGMVSLDTTLEGEQLCLRRSMIKFEGSKDSNLEICGAGYRPLPLYLNQQSIKILEDLGTDPQAFLDLQKQAMDELKGIVQSPRTAAQYLERNLAATAPKLPSLIRNLANLGLNFRDDNFLRNAVDVVALTQLRDIKYKARIPVEKGYTLLGIADTTNFLRAGEVHVCIRNRHGSTDNLSGRVLVTRAPALHPGDVQILEAVDVPKDSPLLALHNCVIFSVQGDRDTPSCLSGGDLDGDLYNVIFDPDLWPKETHEPADYPRPTPIDIQRPVEIVDITRFFIKFMETDQLGYISNTHKQLADQMSLGTKDKNCIKLAEMASTAVDYSKTGVAVDMGEMPPGINRKSRPDFMARAPNLIIDGKLSDALSSGVSLEEVYTEFNGPEDPTDLLQPDRSRPLFYESQKILGRLYRAIDEDAFLPSLHEKDRARSAHLRLVDYRASQFQTGGSVLSKVWKHVQRHTMLVQYDHYMTVALEIKQTYENNLANTMYYYSSHPRQPLTELEVFSGVILGRAGGMPNKRTRETNVDMKGRYDRDVNYIVDWILRGDTDPSEEADEDAESFADWEEDKSDYWEREQDRNYERLARSIAVLKVAMEKPGENVRGAGELKSFKYIAAAVCLREMGRVMPGHAQGVA